MLIELADRALRLITRKSYSKCSKSGPKGEITETNIGAMHFLLQLGTVNKIRYN